MKKHYKEEDILHLKERTVFFDANHYCPVKI